MFLKNLRTLISITLIGSMTLKVQMSNSFIEDCKKILALKKKK
jgi:hypothetical protein